MAGRDAEFLQRLRAAFLVEARDHLLAISASLVALEKAGALADRAQQLEIVFRHTHSLKGAARAASFSRIEALCQLLEEVFAMCKRRGRVLSADDFDLLHGAFDLIGAAVDAGGATPEGTSSEAYASVGQRLRVLASGDAEAEVAPPPGDEAVEASTPTRRAGTRAKPAPGDAVTPPGKRGQETAMPGSVRIESPRLDRLLLAAEELLVVRQASLRNAEDLERLERRFDEWSRRWTAEQAAIRKLRSVASDPAAAEAVEQVVEFLEWTHGHARAVEGSVRALSRAAARDSREAGKQIDALLDDSKRLLMLPFSALSETMPKLVRDLARDQGKQVEVRLEGEGVTLDKRIIESLRDPLVHLVRNAVDHGIEPPARRKQAGKPAAGSLAISATALDGNRVAIEVADDGAGLDPERLRQAAVRAGTMAAENAMQLDDAHALDLAFRSEVTTSPIITEISGRGLGLAIVRDQVERIGGRVEVENRAPAGVVFRMVLPQSMATLRGLFVEAGGHPFVIPSAHVHRALRVPGADVRTVGGRGSLQVEGRAYALARLDRLLGFAPRQAAGDVLTVVLVGTGHESLALVVDEVLHDDEVLVKRLPAPLVRVRNVAGATVLPSGKPVPILNVSDLAKSSRTEESPAVARDEGAPAGDELTCRVLLAEDSITSRLLLRGILESAGCDVVAVADGIEAFTELRSGAYDVLVSDIEMPRLNGFDLTSRVRADRRLADLPVILVTALSRREDRERGIDVGANAYITKGAFDQRDLVDAVRRLAPRRMPA